MNNQILPYVNGNCKEEGRIGIPDAVLPLHTGKIRPNTNVKTISRNI
jgi:hypothetical protein